MAPSSKATLNPESTRILFRHIDNTVKIEKILSSKSDRTAPYEINENESVNALKAGSGALSDATDRAYMVPFL